MHPSKPLLATLLGTSLSWGAGSDIIRLDQVGFASTEHKFAVTLDAYTNRGQVVDSATGTEVFSDTFTLGRPWTESGETTRRFDFSAFTTPGSYMVKVGPQLSHPFRIARNPFRDLARATIKAFWYNRCSYALPSAQAGSWARAAGHPDVSVVVHPSAASSKRPANTTIRSPGGWYDAGDYGKYVVNSGISTWTLLRLYELHRSYFDTLRLGVPSHGGHRSDLVDEALWNLRWMLSMQDPDDGGVYHKLTTAGFSGFVMPNQDNATRYVVMKSTAAALDLAAVAASAARLFQGEPSLPGFSDSCLAAALNAWRWARAHPTTYFDQNAMNAKYSPSIGTGEYGDTKVTDEFAWAAAELLLATRSDSFATAGNLSTRVGEASAWGWPGGTDVAILGWISLLDHPESLTPSASALHSTLKAKLLGVADSIRAYRDQNAYRVPRGGFWWGGNSTFANNGMLLWEAWRLSGDTTYRTASLDVLDYLLGRNATGYSFVTGIGGKTPMNPHHRPSGADGVPAPVPGFLVGGANGGQEDKSQCTYPTTLPARSYVDNQNCYAVNEVAINWNAPLAYLAGVWSATLDTPKPTSTAPRAERSARTLRVRQTGRLLQISMNGQDMVRVELRTPGGRLLARGEGEGSSLSIAVRRSPGLVLVRAWGRDGSTGTEGFVVR